MVSATSYLFAIQTKTLTRDNKNMQDKRLKDEKRIMPSAARYHQHRLVWNFPRLERLSSR